MESKPPQNEPAQVPQSIAKSNSIKDLWVAAKQCAHQALLPNDEARRRIAELESNLAIASRERLVFQEMAMRTQALFEQALSEAKRMNDLLVEKEKEIDELQDKVSKTFPNIAGAGVLAKMRLFSAAGVPLFSFARRVSYAPKSKTLIALSESSSYRIQNLEPICSEKSFGT